MRYEKGSEKSWSGCGGAGMLALRADLISNDDKLGKFLRQFAGPTDGMRDLRNCRLKTRTAKCHPRTQLRQTRDAVTARRNVELRVHFSFVDRRFDSETKIYQSR